MKKLLIGFTLLASMSSFANENQYRLSQKNFAPSQYKEDIINQIKDGEKDRALRLFNLISNDQLEEIKDELIIIAAKYKVPKMFKRLQALGANLYGEDEKGEGLAYLGGVTYSNMSNTNAESRMILSMILSDKEYDINFVDSAGKNLLEGALAGLHLSMFRKILKREDLKVNVVLSDGRTLVERLRSHRNYNSYDDCIIHDHVRPFLRALLLSDRKVDQEEIETLNTCLSDRERIKKLTINY